MLSLWYLILGWKEYNKPFRKAEQPGKPVDPVKKPDLIPQKKDVKPIEPTDVKKPEPPKSIAIDPRPPTIPPRGPDSFFSNNKTPDTPKIPDLPKSNVPSPSTPKVELPKVTPKTPEVPKMPEPPKSIPKTPETPKIPELPKSLPKTPETPKLPEPPKTIPKTPETPKMPEPPKTVPKTPETPKMPDFQRFAPDVPKTPESPKVPELPKFSPKTPESPKVPELPRTPEPPNMMPSRRPESVMPNFPPSSRNPAYVPQPNPSEFDLPPYLPGTPGNQRPASRADELFNVGNNFNRPSPNTPSANLRDLSYAKGELSDDEEDDDFSQESEAFKQKMQEALSRIPKYMEQSVISNPDSLESEEDDV